MSTTPVGRVGSASRSTTATGSTTATVVPLPLRESVSKLIQQHGCGPIQFSGTDNARYERHLVFDNVVDVAACEPRMRFEAFAHSVWDILSQRWVQTEKTYERLDPNCAFYLSLEFLIGGSLANNVTNLLLDPLIRQAIQQKNLDLLQLPEQEPDAGLGGCRLPYQKGTFADYTSERGMQRLGKKKWRRPVALGIARLMAALHPDDVAFGGALCQKP
jgi:glycogen phosphorylase